jgi:hypothetical protein
MLCVSTLVFAANRHPGGATDSFLELSAYFGDLTTGYVVTGCSHGTGAGTSGTISACRAYVRNTSTPQLLQYIEDVGSRTITYSSGDGTYWLIAHYSMTAVVSGWTRVAGTHYMWQFSTTAPATPNQALLLAKVTLSGGAITGFVALAPKSGILGTTVNAEYYGMKCDGTTNNSTALQAAHDALPAEGGKILLPAASLSCKFGTSFAPTKPIWLLGAGGEGANSGEHAETVLEYTGSGTAINLDGKPTVGSILEGFELEHSGTATTGIRIENTSHVVLRDVSMSTTDTKFSSEALKVGDATGGHTVTLQRVYIRNAAPIGVRINNMTAPYIIDSTIQHHSACNIKLGDTGRAKDIHVLYSRLEVSEPTYTSAVGVCVVDVEGLWIDHSHFEIGDGADWAINVPSTATQCEHCVFTNNQFNILNTAPGGDGVINLDAPGTNPAAYVVATGNRVLSNNPTPANANFITLGNTSGNGGATYLVVENNEITSILTVVNNPSYVKGWFRQMGNYNLGASPLRYGVQAISDCLAADTVTGNIGAGVDTIFTCNIGGGNIRASNNALRIVVGGTTAANGNNKEVRVTVGGTQVFTTGVVAANAIDWKIDCEGGRSSGSSIRMYCHGNPLTTTTLKTTRTVISGLDFQVQIAVVVTGEATTTNDITLDYANVELLR